MKGNKMKKAKRSMPVRFSKSVVCCCSLCRILLYAVAGIYMKKNKKKKTNTYGVCHSSNQTYLRVGL